MQLIGFLSFCFVGMTLINRVLEGAFIQSAEASVINAVVVFREISVFGLFTIPVPNMQFITHGIPALMRWDYSYFGGSAAIFRYFLYSASAVCAFLLFTLIIGLLYQYFGRSR